MTPSESKVQNIVLENNKIKEQNDFDTLHVYL